MNEYGKQVAKKMEDYMGNLNSVDKEVSDIQNAMEGVEVRGALAAGVKKSFDKSKVAEVKSSEAYDITQNLLDDSFDTSAINANFEQRLDNEIRNLQPEWTGFKDDVSSQLAKRATATTRDTIYYVSPSGDDSYTGTIEQPFKTLSKAVSMIPDIIGKNNVFTINLLTGVWSEELRVEHLTIHGELVIQGVSDIRENHKVHRVRANSLLGRTTIKNITTTVKTANGASFWFERCAPHVSVDNVKSESDPSVEYGVEGVIGLLADFGSQVHVTNSDFGGKRYGIRSNYLSRIYSKDNSGEGNTFGVGARWGGIVSVHGSQPRGATNLTTDSGGIIGKDYGGIIGLNRDEKGLVEVLGQNESIKRYQFTSATFGQQGDLPASKQLRIRMLRTIDGVHSFKVTYGAQTASSNAQFGEFSLVALISGSSINEALIRTNRGLFLNMADGTVYLKKANNTGEFDLIIEPANALSGRFSVELEVTNHRNSSSPTVLGVFVEDKPAP